MIPGDSGKFEQKGGDKTNKQKKKKKKKKKNLYV